MHMKCQHSRWISSIQVSSRLLNGISGFSPTHVRFLYESLSLGLKIVTALREVFLLDDTLRDLRFEFLAVQKPSHLRGVWRPLLSISAREDSPPLEDGISL
ncbi:hypothetical protein CEXT_302001 [Caerostris extrusa]|uniref:Maturase n=1 Tax=Caerostris extrusa TaxID=172846 RepID=A0AAV4VHB9_CAEEX|nr:hypothetical protein CEXT_302001 [Caerostris extrusa]